MKPPRVVITGLGPVTPVGIGADAFWNALVEGQSGIRRIQAFDPSRFDSQVGGEISGLTVNGSVPKAYRKASKIMARDIVLAVVAAHQAATDAGLRTKCLLERGDVMGEPNLDPARFGANIGAGLICADLPELAEALHSASDGQQFSFAQWGVEGMNNLTPLWLLKFLPNMLACHVTIVHDCQGPSNTITCGEASSHLAIGEAFRTISRRVAEVCICGGAESKANPMALLRQSLGGRLSKRNDQPEQACRPFAANRDGTVISEGGGLVILEELSHAKRRGARIYAELVGFGASNDAYAPGQPSAPSANGRGITLAMRKALKDAGVTPDQVSAVMATGYGMVAQDRSEAAAIREVFGPRAAGGATPATGDSRLTALPVISVKAGLGNNGAGSGAIEFIAAALAMQRGVIPPAINSAPPDPACGLTLATNGPLDAKLEYVVCTAFALTGGQCAALVIKRYAD